MTKIIVFLATGFEEMEALTPVNIWRRAGFEVITVSISNELSVCGSHHIIVMADQLFEDCNLDDADMLFLPGGIPGATNLDTHVGLGELLLSFHSTNKTLGAICAAPLVLGHKQLLKGKKATCFPGFENEMLHAEYTGNSIQSDGNIVTGKGAGVAMEYALQIVARFTTANFANDLAQKMQVSEHFFKL
jgi:4-methyl-5(b-hydroxyethyl)-thiazole monophosphate biosynthesis